MKKISRSKWLACSALIGILACTTGLVVEQKTRSIAEDNLTQVEAFLDNVFVLGDSVEFPEEYENGQAMSRIVYSPSGQAYGTNVLTLDQGGYWTIKYIQGSTVKEYSFFVNTPMFQADGRSTVIGYGAVSEHTKYTAGGATGVVAKIAPNEVLTYNKPIDLTGKTYEDTLVEFSVLPEIAGVADATLFYLTFTDVYDSENVVTIRFRKVESSTTYDNEYSVYVMAAATGQEGKGLTTGNAATHDGFPYGFMWSGFGSEWGTFAPFQMGAYGLTKEQVGTEKLSISMDYARKHIYLNGNLVIDLDEPAFQDVLWDGFTDGRCYLSAYAENYNAVSYNVLFRNIDGETDFYEQLLVNEEKPSIFLQDYDEDIVNGLIIGKPFPVPTAVAYDSFGKELKVKTGVYTAYATGSQANVSIKDGMFTPLQKRDYYIVYSCIDAWGNTTEKILKLAAGEQTKEIALTTAIQEASSIVGQEVAISNFTIGNFVGPYTVKVIAKHGDTSIDVATYHYGEEIIPAYFRPMEVGDWEIVYEYSDYYFQKQATYTLTVNEGAEVFLSDAQVPDFVVKNAVYSKPRLFGYDFSSGIGVEKEAQLFISATENYVASDEVIGDTFTWTKEAGDLYFTYVLGATKKVYVVKSVDVGYATDGMDPCKYFYGVKKVDFLGLEDVGVKFTLDEASAEYSTASLNTTEPYAMSFINALQMYNFTFSYKVPNDVEFSKINVYLRDTFDSDNVLKISLLNKNGMLYYEINDKIRKQFGGNVEELIEIAYNSLTNTLTFAGSDTLLTENLAGEKWNGFAEDSAWLTIAVDTESETAPALLVCGINNQRFYDYRILPFAFYDEKPEVYQDNLAGNKPINTTVSLGGLVIGDVFAVNTSVTLSVVAPNGNYMSTLDGTILDGTVDGKATYDVCFDGYGVYTITYQVKDGLNKSTVFKYNIRVKDMEGPTVTLDNIVSSANKGDGIVFVVPNITDNQSSGQNCKYSTYIQDPDSVMTFVAEDKRTTMKYEKTGYYTIWYYVMDEADNVTIAKYYVYVS